MIFLAAAVSDYYIPPEQLNEHKIQSTEDDLIIKLQPVNKEIFKIKSEWNPSTFLISFKLETDEDLLISKAKKAILKGKSDYVVANLLQTRYDRVLIINQAEKLEILKDDKLFIEENLVNILVSLHDKYILNK
jgi:phosphopantothenate---cysteine ligase (ATP)